MNTETKHTPGPWRLVGAIKGQEVNTWVFGKDPTEGEGRELQVISMIDMHPIKEHLQRRYADMKLIAAAPELLEALQIMVNQFWHNYNDSEKSMFRASYPESSIIKAENAIKKATT